MSKQYCIFCLVAISYFELLNSASIPLRPLIPLTPTSTYKPSTLLLPPGFDSEKAPRQPMLYPYAVTSSGISIRTNLKSTPNTTPGWIPVSLNTKGDLPLISNSYSTAPNFHSKPVPVLEDRIAIEETKYSSPSLKEGPVFESIVYGTWKPDPPLQPVEITNGTKQHQYEGTTNNTGLVVDGKIYNKTINRQHGGFIGQIQQKPTKIDRRIFSSSVKNEMQQLADFRFLSKQQLQPKIKKQGRRKISPLSSTTEQISIAINSNRVESTTTNEFLQHLQNATEANTAETKFMEDEEKRNNESIEIKYNHKQTSTHSIDMMTTAHATDDDDYLDDDKMGAARTQWTTKSTKFLTTQPQITYDDESAVATSENISATRRSWPTDFIEEPLTTTDLNYKSINNSDDFDFLNVSRETDPSEIPLALSALNIPPSLWPKLPGNITKLGTPYDAESSAEEPALCVPITVQEQNIMNSRELVYIERVFCFPMPPLSTTTERSVNTLESTFTSSSSSTFKTVTTAKVQNFNDFIDSNSRVSNASSIFKDHFYLITFILVIYFKIIV